MDETASPRSWTQFLAAYTLISGSRARHGVLVKPSRSDESIDLEVGEGDLQKLQQAQAGLPPNRRILLPIRDRRIDYAGIEELRNLPTYK